jgi:asparagine synthase (glutamine-hydrolysing)
MLGPPDCDGGTWLCWLFGQPEDRGALAARFGLGRDCDLSAAFGRAVAEQGEAACELLSDRFVVVLFNRERDRAFVARDQLGAQPLVYTSVADGILFAEHERDLLDLLPRTPSPDRLALLQWIGNGTIPRGHTLYDRIHRLPAGHRLGLEEAQVRIERWWTLRYAGTEDGTTMALAERLREAAFAAVGRSAAGSRRPAVELSGGLDSACVAAGLAADGSADGRALALGGTFSAYPETDERELIEATARKTRLPLELIAFKPGTSMLTPALEHIARWRLPPATSNLFLWQPLMARARGLGVDRILDGEGGDELFGFAPHLIADMLRAGRLRTAWSLTGLMPDVGVNPGTGVRLRVIRYSGIRPFLPIALRQRRERARAASASSIVPPRDAQALVDLRFANQEHQRDGPMWWRLLTERLIDLRDDLDMGSHFRREAADEHIDLRHPLLYDLTLIESALRLPPRAQFDPVRDRPLLRDALSGVIPEAVRTRHAKSHFNPPILDGIRADESGLIEPLRQADAPVRAYVASEALDRKIAVAPEERPMVGVLSLWRLAIANRWLLSHTDPSS